MIKSFRRTVGDTWEFFGWKPAALVGLAALAGAVAILMGSGVHSATIWSLVGGAFIVLTGGLFLWAVAGVFLVNLARAPFRNARDEAEKHVANRLARGSRLSGRRELMFLLEMETTIVLQGGGGAGSRNNRRRKRG